MKKNKKDEGKKSVSKFLDNIEEMILLDKTSDASSEDENNSLLKYLISLQEIKYDLNFNSVCLRRGSSIPQGMNEAQNSFASEMSCSMPELTDSEVLIASKSCSLIELPQMYITSALLFDINEKSYEENVNKSSISLSNFWSLPEYILYENDAEGFENEISACITRNETIKMENVEDTQEHLVNSKNHSISEQKTVSVDSKNFSDCETEDDFGNTTEEEGVQSTTPVSSSDEVHKNEGSFMNKNHSNDGNSANNIIKDLCIKLKNGEDIQQYLVNSKKHPISEQKTVLLDSKNFFDYETEDDFGNPTEEEGVQNISPVRSSDEVHKNAGSFLNKNHLNYGNSANNIIKQPGMKLKNGEDTQEHLVNSKKHSISGQKTVSVDFKNFSDNETEEDDFGNSTEGESIQNITPLISSDEIHKNAGSFLNKNHSNDCNSSNNTTKDLCIKPKNNRSVPNLNSVEKKVIIISPQNERSIGLQAGNTSDDVSKRQNAQILCESFEVCGKITEDSTKEQNNYCERKSVFNEEITTFHPDAIFDPGNQSCLLEDDNKSRLQSKSGKDNVNKNVEYREYVACGNDIKKNISNQDISLTGVVISPNKRLTSNQIDVKSEEINSQKLKLHNQDLSSIDIPSGEEILSSMCDIESKGLICQHVEYRECVACGDDILQNISSQDKHLTGVVTPSDKIITSNKNDVKFEEINSQKFNLHNQDLSSIDIPSSDEIPSNQCHTKSKVIIFPQTIQKDQTAFLPYAKITSISSGIRLKEDITSKTNLENENILHYVEITSSESDTESQNGRQNIPLDVQSKKYLKILKCFPRLPKRDNKKRFKNVFSSLKLSTPRFRRNKKFSETSVSDDGILPEISTYENSPLFSELESENGSLTFEGNSSPNLRQVNIDEVFDALLLMPPYLDKLERLNLKPAYDVKIEESKLFHSILPNKEVSFRDVIFDVIVWKGDSENPAGNIEKNVSSDERLDVQEVRDFEANADGENLHMEDEESKKETGENAKTKKKKVRFKIDEEDVCEEAVDSPKETKAETC